PGHEKGTWWGRRPLEVAQGERATAEDGATAIGDEAFDMVARGAPAARDVRGEVEPVVTERAADGREDLHVPFTPRTGPLGGQDWLAGPSDARDQRDPHSGRRKVPAWRVFAHEHRVDRRKTTTWTGLALEWVVGRRKTPVWRVFVYEHPVD